MWPTPVRAVVFDMDGLLIDTERLVFQAMSDVAPRFGIEMDRGLFASMIGLDHDTNVVQLKTRFGPDVQVAEFYKAVGVQFREVHDAEVALKDGVIEILDHLDLLGLPRAICTSSSHDSVQRHLGPHGLLPRFGAIVARGDYPRSKPAPDPFLTAARALDVAPEHCLALEDSHNGVRAACAAGMMTVMVPDMLDVTDEMNGLALRIATSLHDVRTWLPTAPDRP